MVLMYFYIYFVFPLNDDSIIMLIEICYYVLAAKSGMFQLIILL